MPQARDEAGNIWEVDAQGNAVRLVSAAQQQAPADPTFQYQGPQAAASAANAQADASVNAATVPDQVRKTRADATTAERGASTAGLPEGFMWSNDGRSVVPIPGYSRQGISPDIRKGAIEAFNDAKAIEQTVANLRRQFYSGPGQTSGLAGLQDYLPTGPNKVFNDTGNRARGMVKRALGFTGGEGNTVAESEALYGPFLPQAGDKDEQIAAKIAALEGLGRQAREKAVTILGGEPDENGNVRPNAMTAIRTDGGRANGVSAASRGSDTTAVPYPEAGQAEHDFIVARLIGENGGRLDPAAYVRERQRLDEKYGVTSDPAALEQWAGTVNQYLGSGGRTVPTGIQAAQRPMTETEIENNNAVNNPLAATFVGAVDGATGIPTALAGDQMAALSEAQFPAVLGGQALGAIGTTTGIGALGRFGASRLAPQLLGGGSKAQFGRNVATDMVYGSGYTGITEGDPLSGAAYGAVGSAVGQPLGSLAGKAIGGVSVPDSVKALASRGIPMTTGQRLGGAAKAIEDRATSVPFVGDMINARRMEGLDAFNRQAFADAGQSIGFTPQRTGKEGIQDLYGAAGQAYDDATRGVTVPLDDEFYSGVDSVRSRGAQLPEDLAARFGKAMDNRVNPIAQGREVWRPRYPDSLAHPTTPTAEQMQKLGSRESVPLESVVSDQKQFDWVAQAAGRYNEPLIPGYGSRPVAIKMRDGSYSLVDGNHRTVRAMNDGRKNLEMDTIEARLYDPENAGRPAPQSTMSDDDLLAELGAELEGINPSPASSQAYQRTGREAMTGNSYQQAMRGLKSYKAETTKPGFEQDYREALTGAMDVLTGQMQRGGGDSVVSGLADADKAYRNTKMLENAVQRAKGGSQSGESYTFTPSQLQMSVQQGQRKYPGATPLEGLADAGQDVLPSRIPDSGTAGRVAQMAVPVGAIGAGGGAGYLAGGGDGAQTGATATALATALAVLGGTKGGQAAINKALFDRPEAVENMVKQVRASNNPLLRRRSGLFGSAAVPMVMAAQ